MSDRFAIKNNAIILIPYFLLEISCDHQLLRTWTNLADAAEVLFNIGLYLDIDS